MCPTASRLMRQSSVHPAAAALLLSLCLGFTPWALACPPGCICASDIVSCSGSNLSTLPPDLPDYAARVDLSHNSLTALPADWIRRPFDRLAALLLGRNSIRQIEANAFAVTPRLLHLDLSSNKLSVLNSSIFSGLAELRELLLFGNQIVQINPNAFSGLRSLVKLYLSGNGLTSLPVILLDGGGPLNLTFLDVSSNKIIRVHVHMLLTLSRHAGIYLQGNPLTCDCALLGLLEYWTWKQYLPLLDFKDDYLCRDDTVLKLNCTTDEVVPVEAGSYQVDPGKWLRLPCPGFSSNDPAVFWVTPTTVLNSSAHDPNAHLAVLPNGSLEIRGALTEDSGTYACVAARGRETSPEVNVVVGNLSSVAASGSAHRGGGEHFNTAFTTLASCVVSIILVLLYLYLTPCRCRENRGGASRGCGGRAIILCSDPRDVESGQRRSNGKRVAFLEPQMEDGDTAGAKSPVINTSHASTEGILKNGNRTVGQSPTDTTLIV
ncbi:amphoterin-induced protein 2-like [Corythoichthys intestinalis]|uniref:amphoterin-induced protein 2-like n=1 Tax=Corythoichthys intestinalis TaxID=161448 RepID=UPI0025A5A513|nr:amphoterin-induced protein 2-like [Corythoichthys intestinalis]XP_061809528.1 amphoterin-induced protein 2-like [Nerophis lumbriciformis]